MTIRVNKPAFNIREKLSELERPIGLKGSELMSSATVQEARDLVSAGRRNLIINGDMRISQRGTTFTSFSSGEYSLDRMMMGSANSNYTITKGSSTLPTGRDVNTFKIECTTATSNWLDPYQGIEDIHIIENQTITISAWVKTNHPLINFRQYGMQNFGDVFIPDGEWHHYSETTTLGDLTLTKGGSIGSAYFGITNRETTSWTVGQYIEFTHFQIELGKNATEFEHRPISEEIALCHRYFWQPVTSQFAASSAATWGAMGISYSANTYYIPIQFPTAMRIPPSVGGDGSWRTRRNNINSFTPTFGIHGNGNVNGCILGFSGGSIGAAEPFWFEAHGTDANLFFNAEL